MTEVIKQQRHQNLNITIVYASRYAHLWAFLVVHSDGKESTCNAGDLGSIPGLGRSSEEGMATYSSILAWGIFRDRGVGWAIIAPGVAESDTTERLSIHSHTYTSIYVSFSLLGVNHTFSVYYIICAKLNITLQLYSCMIK